MRLSTRWLIVIFGLGFLWPPLVATAQLAGKVRRLGILGSGAAPSAAELAQSPFWQALHEFGWVEGNNITVERRYAEGHSERLPALTAELIHLGVEVIVTIATPAALAAKQATTTLPIVMWGATAAVETGLVTSLTRPDGNLTGVTSWWPALIEKQLELLREAVPSVSRVAIVWYPDNPAAVVFWQQAQGAAQALGMTVLSLEVLESNTLERLFTAITQERPDALLLFSGPFVSAHQTEIAAFAVKNGLPTFGQKSFVQAGGLLSYGGSSREIPRLIAAYVDKILQGAKPADLPVERPTKFELVINLKTAQALGLTIPPTVLFQADEVIR
jgi:putative ABC transport system substrate-binding protein